MNRGGPPLKTCPILSRITRPPLSFRGAGQSVFNNHVIGHDNPCYIYVTSATFATATDLESWVASEIKMAADDQVVTETFGDNQGKNGSGKSGKYDDGPARGRIWEVGFIL